MTEDGNKWRYICDDFFEVMLIVLANGFTVESKIEERVKEIF